MHACAYLKGRESNSSSFNADVANFPSMHRPPYLKDYKAVDEINIMPLRRIFRKKFTARAMQSGFASERSTKSPTYCVSVTFGGSEHGNGYSMVDGR